MARSGPARHLTRDSQGKCLNGRFLRRHHAFFHQNRHQLAGHSRFHPQKLVVMPAATLIVGMLCAMDPLNLKMLVVANACRRPSPASSLLADEYDTYVATGTSSLTLSVILFAGFCPLVDLDNRYLHQNVLLTRRFIDIAADILLTGRENPDGFSRPFLPRRQKKQFVLGQKNFSSPCPKMITW